MEKGLKRKTNKDIIYKYYLKHEHECFISYKTRGAAERFIPDKARIASVLNSFKNDPFYTHLVTLFTKEFSIWMLYKPRKSRQTFCENLRVFYHI